MSNETIRRQLGFYLNTVRQQSLPDDQIKTMMLATLKPHRKLSARSKKTITCIGDCNASKKLG